MPVPLVVWAILEITLAALAIYETMDVLKDIYEGIDSYNKSVDKAKEELKDLIDKLKKEIDQKIEEKEEVAILLAASAADPQGPVTRKAAGRGSGTPVINSAIEQRIPFRQVISLVCEKAEALPVLSLRRKKGVTISDLPKAKRKALEELLEKSFETITDADLEDFIVVRLKQLAANLMFEFVDYCIDWQSPLKCEVSFGPAPNFDDHPVVGTTRLKRSEGINPFYPAPHRRKGSLAADLIIPDYRKKRCDKSNIFAIVEVKFPGDTIDEKQFRTYQDLLKVAARVKTGVAPVRFDSQPVAYGGRLSLFRFPEDAAAKAESKPDSKRPRGKPGRNRD